MFKKAIGKTNGFFKQKNYRFAVVELTKTVHPRLTTLAETVSEQVATSKHPRGT